MTLCSPSPWDGQRAAASTRAAVLRLVGGGGAGRPGLGGRVGEVLLGRVQLVPNNHLRGGGGAFPPAEWGDRRHQRLQKEANAVRTAYHACLTCDRLQKVPEWWWSFRQKKKQDFAVAKLLAAERGNREACARFLQSNNSELSCVA